MIQKILEQNFSYEQGENIVILNDILKKNDKDSIFRQKLAQKWLKELKQENYSVSLVKYRATYSNNGELPGYCFLGNEKKSFKNIFSNSDIVIALNKYSATAPLHTYAKRYMFRAASMPGFNKKMLPALDIDYNDIKKKVDKIYHVLENAESADVIFKSKGQEYSLFIDLSKRMPLKDNGDCSEKGKVINLPSGECFIAPLDTKESKTKGFLPIQEGKNVTVYEVKNNFICDADKKTKLLEKIKQDKAVGNIAEFAFGVLAMYGIKSCGKILLDEKLGMHIALGRNDHFSGNVSPSSFRKRQNVWHQDYVYIKEMQPKIDLAKIVVNKKNKTKLIIENNKYKIF